MIFFLPFLLLCLVPFCKNSDEIQKLLDDIKHTEEMPYRAGADNFPKEVTMNDLKKLVSSNKVIEKNVVKKVLYHKFDEYTSPPSSYDIRQDFPDCADLIGTIKDQGKCDTGWAVATASAISDRICIETGKIVDISAEDLFGCCDTCEKTECGMGHISLYQAWEFWVKKGIVSGGDYKSNKGCKPLSESTYNNGLTECTKNCNNKNITYEKDKHFGGMVYFLPENSEQIQIDIMNHGPVTARIRVYDGLFVYKEGMYTQSKRRNEMEMGRHVVKIIGWDSTMSSGFWLCVNSWGKRWGDKGMFTMWRNFGTEEEKFYQKLFKKRSDRSLTIDNYVVAGRINPNITKKEYFVPFYESSAESNELSIILSFSFFMYLLLR